MLPNEPQLISAKQQADCQSQRNTGDTKRCRKYSAKQKHNQCRCPDHQYTCVFLLLLMLMRPLFLQNVLLPLSCFCIGTKTFLYPTLRKFHRIGQFLQFGKALFVRNFITEFLLQLCEQSLIFLQLFF